jgi:hypothetical protein
MRHCLGSAVVALVLIAGTGWADPPKAKTVTYDVSDLLRKPGRTGAANIEEIAKLIAVSVDPDSWNKPGDGTLEQIDGTHLQITTTPARHSLIVELLATKRRLYDLRVDLKCELFEVERKVYEKEFKNKLKDGRAAVAEEAVAATLRERGTRLKDATTHAADGETTPIVVLRRAFTHITKPAVAGKTATYGSGLAGLRLTAAVTVTPDRRYIQMKLTQRTTELVAIKKRTVFNPDSGDDEEIEVPDLAETITTTNAEVGDGETLLLPVTLGDGKDKERVRLLLLRTTIYIEEEEKERKKSMP